MYAVTIPPLNTTFFVCAPPGQVPGEVQDNVEINIHYYLYLTSRECETPDQVLCVRKTDPKHYKTYKLLRDVDQEKYTPTGRNFGAIYSGETWKRFLEIRPRYLEFAALPDEEPEAAPDQALRALGAVG